MVPGISANEQASSPFLYSNNPIQDKCIAGLASLSTRRFIASLIVSSVHDLGNPYEVDTLIHGSVTSTTSEYRKAARHEKNFHVIDVAFAPEIGDVSDVVTAFLKAGAFPFVGCS